MHKGVKINGSVYDSENPEGFDTEEFINEFIEWLEDKGLSFGGSSVEVDLDK